MNTKSAVCECANENDNNQLPNNKLQKAFDNINSILIERHLQKAAMHIKLNDHIYSFKQEY